MALVNKATQTANALELRDEQKIRANTKTRVFNLFKNLIDSAVFFDQIVHTTGNSATNVISQSGMTVQLNLRVSKTQFNSYTASTKTLIENVTATTLTIEAFDDYLATQEAIPSTGSSIHFDRRRIYGVFTPITGNIILGSAETAKLGMEQIVKHNQGTEPIFDTPFKKLSGVYVPGMTNYIRMTYLGENEILYTISQIQ
jgi:hypothetical protein